MTKLLEPGVLLEGTTRPVDIVRAIGRALCRPRILDATSQWHSLTGEERSHELSMAFDEAEESCPDGYWFGTHPDDGACWGVWEQE